MTLDIFKKKLKYYLKLKCKSSFSGLWKYFIINATTLGFSSFLNLNLEIIVEIRQKIKSIIHTIIINLIE